MKRSTTLHIHGLSCSGCIFNIVTSLMNKKGVENIDVDLKTELSRIKYNDAEISFSEILSTIKKLGFKVNYSS